MRGARGYLCKFLLEIILFEEVLVNILTIIVHLHYEYKEQLKEKTAILWKLQE